MKQVVELILIIFLIFFVGLFLCQNVMSPSNRGTEDFGWIAIENLKHQKQNNTYRFVAAMVEPRTANLIETIETFKKVLPKDVHFQIYHGIKNKDLLENTYKNDIDEGKISLWNMGVENLTLRSYNVLLTSIEFWNTMRSENVLIFQTDSTPCSSSHANLEQFLEYDYVGAPFHPIKNFFLMMYMIGSGIYGKYVNMMNGGLSLRKKSTMIQCIENEPWNKKLPEDEWFCMRIHKLNKKLPNSDIAKKFSSDGHLPTEGIPWGVHKPVLTEGLYDICPEIKNLQTI